MFNIISYQENANQTHTETHFTPTRMEKLAPLYTTDRNIKWYTQPLFKWLLKVKCEVTIWPSNSTRYPYLRKMKTYICTKIVCKYSYSAFFIIARNRKTWNVYRLMHGKIKWGISIRWNTIQQWKGVKYWCILKKGELATKGHEVCVSIYMKCPE